ncbi:MAG TPA: glycoside hydrolase family 16 protein [Bryobacteraceae bacterium]|nr:glycoside hydrolase family 16 protein [Bryobacteraceae bacterium]
MKLLLALFAALTGTTFAIAQPRPQLVWSDEFNGAPNTAPDPAKWTYDLGNNKGWGNRELESYTKDPENAHLDGKGNLVIRAEPAKGAANSYTSARIKTQGLFAASPNGRVEARIKVPAGAGIWPAFWMLGNTFNGRNWPACGEIDIMESLGREPSINHGSLHGPGYSGGKPMTSIYTLPGGRKFSDDFHIFAIDWKPDEITFYVDDTAYETVRDTDIPAGTKWVFDQPFFLILNVAVGGNFGGPVGAATVFPQEMLVDYVRVFKRAR